MSTPEHTPEIRPFNVGDIANATNQADHVSLNPGDIALTPEMVTRVLAALVIADSGDRDFAGEALDAKGYPLIAHDLAYRAIMDEGVPAFSVLACLMVSAKAIEVARVYPEPRMMIDCQRCTAVDSLLVNGLREVEGGETAAVAFAIEELSTIYADARDRGDRVTQVIAEVHLAKAHLAAALLGDADNRRAAEADAVAGAALDFVRITYEQESDAGAQRLIAQLRSTIADVVRARKAVA